MRKIDTIRRVEEASFNAWPALKTIIYDGWLLRFANGYTKRANSVNGLYASRLPAEVKITYCQKAYRRQNLHPVFRLTPLLNRDELDSQLAARQYKRSDHTTVQFLDLQTLTPQLSPRAEIWSGAEGIDAWLHAFHTLNPQRRDAVTHRQMMQNILGSLCLMVLKVNGEIVACGLAVADGAYVGLFDIVTAASQRRRGYGLELTTSLLAWGASVKTGTAYLQVMTDNQAALGLYHKLRFEALYDYWYRIAPDNEEEL